MDNLTFIEVEAVGHAVSENEDGSFTSMTKARYEELNEASSL